MSFWDLANTYIIYALVLRLEGDLDRAVVVLQLNDQLLGLLITGADDLRAKHRYVANQVAAAGVPLRPGRPAPARSRSGGAIGKASPRTQ